MRVTTGAAIAAIALVPLLAACSDDSNDSGSTTTVTASPGTSGTPATVVSGATIDLATTDLAIGWRKALEIAGQQFNGRAVTLKLEREVGAPQYQVTLVSETEEADVDIDANTGSVVGKEVDAIERDDLNNYGEPLVFDGLIEPSAAMVAAKKSVDGPVSEWKLERDRNLIVYEVNIDNATDDDVEVIIDAKTGAVIRVDK